MSEGWKKCLSRTNNQVVIGGLLILGLWLIVIRPLGPNLALIPGDLGDVRFNNYILEHFFRWVNGLEKSFWNAPMFFPYPMATAFSDNLLGSAPFYALLRWTGLDRETSYQGWYILGFGLNYLAVTFVLSRLKFSSLATAAGAFYFSFGLPILAQENHPQLLYRFGIPLACFALWQFTQAPRLRTLIFMAAAVVVQFFLGIYNGIFLIFLLVATVVVLPLCLPDLSLSARLKFWPRQVVQAWIPASVSTRVTCLISLAGLTTSLTWLLWPYFHVSELYGFVRNWYQISSMLPRWRSYFLADGSSLWLPVSQTISGMPMRHEHQLFPGMIAILILVILPGILWFSNSKKRTLLWVHIGALAILIVLTLYVSGDSLYRLISNLPGISSIRAVTRIMLVLMYPLAVVIASGIDGLLTIKNHFRLASTAAAVILIAVMIAEPILYNHITFSKTDAQARVTTIEKTIPAQIPQNPLLIFNLLPNQPDWASEIDAMIAGQERGWPVFNGYSGNFPPGYGISDRCAQLPRRILFYMNFTNQVNEQLYMDLVHRSMPIGFDDCDPAWWETMPSITTYTGPLPAESFAQIELKIKSLTITSYGIRASYSMSNHGAVLIPARSSTQNEIKLAWRLVNLNPQEPLPAFDVQKRLDFDILPAASTIQVIGITPPPTEGLYRLELTAVQEGVTWFHDQGMQIALSDQLILMDANLTATVIENPGP